MHYLMVNTDHYNTVRIVQVLCFIYLTIAFSIGPLSKIRGPQAHAFSVDIAYVTLSLADITLHILQGFYYTDEYHNI